MADLAFWKPSGAAQEDRAAVPDKEMQNSKIETSLDCKIQERGGACSINANEKEQAEALEHVSSPWVTTKSLNPETLCCVEEASNLKSNKGRWKKLGGNKSPTIDHTVKFFSTHIPTLQSGYDNQKLDRLTGRRKKGEDGSSQWEGDFTFATPQGAPVSDKEVMEDKTKDKRTETLKIKLWEILGNISSPKSHPSNSQVRHVGSDMLKPAQILEQKGDLVVESRHQPGAIEADTENPDCTMKRPVTWSLTRKRISTEKLLGKTKADPLSSGRQKFQEKNIFDGEGLFRKGKTAANGGSSLSMQKKGQIKSMSIKPQKILFTENNNVNNHQGETHRSETSAPAVKTFSAGNRMGNFSGFDTQNDNDSPKFTEKNQEMGSCPPSGRTSHQSLGTPWTDQQGSSDSPVIQDNQGQQEDSTDHFQSPTLKISSPILSSAPCSTLKTKQLNQNFGSPEQAERVFMNGNIRSFRTLQNLKVNILATNAQTETEDETAQPEESIPWRRPSHLQKQNYVECCLPESSSEDENPHSSKGGSPINKEDDDELSNKDEDSDIPREGSPIINECRETESLSPEAATALGSKFTIYTNKILCTQRYKEFDEFNRPFPFTRVAAGSDCIPQRSRQIHEDDLQRVVMHIALAVQNYKKKMRLTAKRKSSDILMSVTEDINEELQIVESQIHSDLEKLTNLSTSKRKRLEGRFQEQQEQLMLIRENFRTDMHRHLNDFKSTLEGLEVHQYELKGAVKSQKASHQKLLVQAREAIETKLNHAQRRITKVQKSAREKMLQLRRCVAECLNEGIMS